MDYNQNEILSKFNVNFGDVVEDRKGSRTNIGKIFRSSQGHPRS